MNDFYSLQNEESCSGLDEKLTSTDFEQYLTRSTGLYSMFLLESLKKNCNAQ